MTAILKMEGQNGIFLMGFLETELIAEQRGLALDFPYLMPVLGACKPSNLPPQLSQPCTCSPAGLCRRCPWNWDFFQGSCYIFSKIQSTWDASVSACEDMRAQLVVINNAEEQVCQAKFLSGVGPDQQKVFCPLRDGDLGAM